MTFETISGYVSFIISIIAIGLSIYSAVHSRRMEKENKYHNRRLLTLSAFNQLQAEVLDKIILCTSEEIDDVVENHFNDDDLGELYDLYRTQIARLEHFALGVNEELYDYDTFNKLAGLHMIFAIEKIMPIIIEVRNDVTTDDTAYCEVEKLYERLKKDHKC